MHTDFAVPLLVVAAWEPELERFCSLLSRGLSLGSAGVVVDVLGIGLVDAALGMARSLTRHAPSGVVFIGTCGAAPGGDLAIGDVVVGSAIALADLGLAEGRSAMPFTTSPLVPDAALASALCASGARPATIVNTLGITTDDGLAAKLAPHGQVEHLEAYGVTRACQVASVPCAILLAVANIVGATGREEWRANHVAASACAAEIAYAALAALRTSTTPRSPA